MLDFSIGLLVGMLVGIILTAIYYRRIVAATQKEIELVKANLQLKVNKIP